MSKKQTLGRGLSALIGGDVNVNQKKSDVAVLEKPNTSISKVSKVKAVKKSVKSEVKEESKLGFMDLQISSLVTGNFQPRGIFADEELKELSISIKANGVMQPILVRPTNKKGVYE